LSKTILDPWKETLKGVSHTIKRDLQKRPISIKRDLEKETYIHGKRPTKGTYLFAAVEV